MNLAADSSQRVVALCERLSPDKLAIALNFLEQIQELSLEETGLLQKVYQLPVIDRVRLADLRDRCEWGALNQSEHEELLQYEELFELHNVSRVEAIMKLAQLKNIDFATLYQQLTSPQSYAA